ncbi:MAG: OmpA family protein [bacterium]|nr:OmpA family protein [bacterium]
MSRSRYVITLTMLGVGLLATTGCGPDPKERIALLEDENRQLLSELDHARSGQQQAGSDRDLCEQELAALRGDNSDLQRQLADARSAPPPAEVPEGWTSIPGGAMINIEGEVLFRSGKAALRPEARSTLDAVARTLNSEYGEREVLVYGHTDAQPIKKSGWKDNLELSAPRALSVVRYLQSRGVAPRRVVAGGCGEYRPLVTRAGDVSQNRRVEVYVLDNVTQTAGR